MRPLPIEFLEEFIETRLLLKTVYARRPGGFLFQRQMHAPVAAIPRLRGDKLAADVRV